MPDRAHVPVERILGRRLSDVAASWMPFAAKRANRLLGRSGRFRAADYRDRFIRDERRSAAARRYVRENPVKAGSCAAPSDRPWFSASPGPPDANETSALPENGAQPAVVAIAGPNGAGKTTFATEYLPNEAACPRFVNADLIAAGLNPFRPEEAAFRAGRLMLEEMEAYARAGRSFAFETTLSGRGHARRIREWRARGYRVRLVFLRLPTPELAIARVARRVALGGHGVPEEAIRRRFFRGWRNFKELYRGLVDDWKLYDNAGKVPVLLAGGGRE